MSVMGARGIEPVVSTNLNLRRARVDEVVDAVRGLLEVIADIQPWETCLACGCLCRADELCPMCKVIAAGGHGQVGGRG